MTNKALVVLSGGQDSTTCLFWAKAQGFDEIHAVTFDYGQRHAIEIEAAITVANMAGCSSHEVIRVPDILRSTSPLTSGAELEQYENAEEMATIIGERVEKTFVPMRNTLFLTIAVNRAIDLGCFTVVTGICEEDNANYPDCTERFRGNFEYLSNISLGLPEDRRIKVVAPLMWRDKCATVQLAKQLPGCWEAMAYTHTSYDGKYPPTDMNHANVLRAKGFEEAGLPDPLVIRAFEEGLMGLPNTKNYDEWIRQDEERYIAEEGK